MYFYDTECTLYYRNVHYDSRNPITTYFLQIFDEVFIKFI